MCVVIILQRLPPKSFETVIRRSRFISSDKDSLCKFFAISFSHLSHSPTTFPYRTKAPRDCKSRIQSLVLLMRPLEHASWQKPQYMHLVISMSYFVVLRDPSSLSSASMVIACAGQMASHNLHAMHLLPGWISSQSVFPAESRR